MFGQNNKRIVIACYRTQEFDLQGKKTKKIQKDVLRRSATMSTRDYDVATAYTGPIKTLENTTESQKYHRNSRIRKKGKRVVFDLCECHEDIPDNVNEKYHPKTWESLTQWYGDADTTEVWPATQNQIEKFGIEERNLKKSKKYVEVPEEERSYNNTKNKNKNRKSKTHKKRNHQNQQQSTAVLSLYRNENKRPEISPNENYRFEKTTKAKKADTTILPGKTKFQENCPEGPCATAEALGNKNFFCRCINRKREPIIRTEECTDDNCKFERKSLSISSVVKLKQNIICVCSKYSQKVLNIKPQADPGNTVKDIKPKSAAHTTRKLKSTDLAVKKTHESEQTGGAFFEVLVNPRDMCVLNPVEIKDNIIKYGKSRFREPSCICPSRGTLRPGEICKEGICKKAYKNKQMNFNCWCDKKIAECGDASCDLKILRNSPKKLTKENFVSYQKANKPLLEVQLDMDKMCVVNPEEIEHKIMNNISVDEICSSGICRDAAIKQKIPFSCKCISKKLHSEITDCSEGTCKDITQKKRSKFCLFCTRLCSKSENWPYRNREPRRVQRRSFYEIGPHKLCKGKLCTQSDNLNKNRELYSNSIDLKHLPTCNCEECKGIKKTALRRRKDIHTIIQNDSSKLRKIKEVEKHNPKKETRTPSPKKEKRKYNSNPRNAKTIEIPKESLNKVNVVDDLKTVLKKAREKEKIQRYKIAQKLKNKKMNEINFNKELKKRTKLDKKGEKKASKERRRAIRLMQKKMKEEPLDANFCTAFLLGIVKIGLKTMLFIFYIIYSIIRNPKKCYWYVRDRIRDPEGTYKKIKNWFHDALMIKKLEVSETVRGSDTLTILADHFMDSPFYQTIADKGRTKEEQMLFEQKNKARKRRIRKREQQAIHSCRHMLLTTLRQTPCLWVYHICPNFYPQCLSLLAFMRSFSRILMFLIAFACWTPCILSFELCRACLCCFMCTG